MDHWIEQLRLIIKEYKGKGNDDPLDGDEVEKLCDAIKACIDYNEGNITEEEYEDQIKEALVK